MMFSFLILEPENYSPHAINIYQKIGNIFFYPNINSDEKKIITCLVVRLGFKIDKNLLSEFDNLKWIITPTTGLTHIDLEVCKANNICIFSLINVREKISSITSTAELALGLMLSLARGVNQGNKNIVENGIWDRNLHRTRQVSSLTIGLIGLGRVGGMVAKALVALGCRVDAYDPYQANHKFEECGVGKVDDIQMLFMQSDIISVHASYTANNHNLINHKLLNLMKKNSILINTARGELINEIDLVKAIDDGTLLAVGVDVLKDESDFNKLFNSPVIQAAKSGKNILITPHIGGCTIEAMAATEDMMANFFYDQYQALEAK